MLKRMEDECQPSSMAPPALSRHTGGGHVLSPSLKPVNELGLYALHKLYCSVIAVRGAAVSPPRQGASYNASYGRPSVASARVTRNRVSGCHHDFFRCICLRPDCAEKHAQVV